MMDQQNCFCKDCKHCYTYFKQITNERGLPDFISIPKCRKDYKINSDGTPFSNDCFEHR